MIELKKPGDERSAGQEKVRTPPLSERLGEGSQSGWKGWENLKQGFNAPTWECFGMQKLQRLGEKRGEKNK